MGRLATIHEGHGAASSFEPLLDSATAADMLKIHRKTLERMALRGEVPGHKIGKFWRFRASELDEWLRSRVNSGCQPCCTNTPQGG
jgi:excisionase family DNA binding protein